MTVVGPLLLVVLLVSVGLWSLRSQRGVFDVVANLLIAFALLGLVVGGLIAAWGSEGRELGHGLATLLGGGLAGISLILLVLVVAIKIVVRRQRR
jgi:hypothetical protein